jgi:hypothetical protein
MNRKFSWNSAWKLFVRNFLPEIRQGAKYPASDLQQWGHGSFLAFKTGHLIHFHCTPDLQWREIKLVIYLTFCLYPSLQLLSIQLPESPIPAKFWFSRANTLAMDVQYVYNKQHNRVYYSRSRLWKRVQL